MRILLGVGSLGLAFLTFTACGGPRGASSDQCRFEPDECRGGLGGSCFDDRDCDFGGECCESDNCGGGMCTFECRGDEDCPADMRCEHDTCFYACEFDEDCAIGMSCEHDRVCEWDG